MSNKEDYLSFLKDNNAETHNRSESVFNYSKDETNLGEDEYFLMSDDWLRGSIKEINYNQIDGIVLGILE
ncbi:hypothetical protein BTS2_1381 [Bacillus sp. TS-2]|nr:hypothetical protein BTS2_1381 [Bacillus sp. TS-2]